MTVENIVRGQLVRVYYNKKWWISNVTGVSKKTGRVTVWIGDYMRLNVHCSQLKELSNDNT